MDLLHFSVKHWFKKHELLVLLFVPIGLKNCFPTLVHERATGFVVSFAHIIGIGRNKSRAYEALFYLYRPGESQGLCASMPVTEGGD